MNVKRIFDLEKLTALRQNLHKFAEGSFQEFETSKKIKSALLSFGLLEQNIRSAAKTGLVVDIQGKAEPVSSLEQIVAFRADMDALEMEENNENLEYRSVTKFAHMCGHDGHMTCLLGGISMLMENVDKMPSNKVARFLFQPAEEKYGGAKVMIDEGCLDGVSEVWGLHNLPLDPPGQIRVIPGPIMSEVIAMRISVAGKGGHSSLKENLVDPVFPGCEIVVNVEKLLETEFAKWNNKDLIVSFPSIKGTQALNVIPDEITLSGALRSFDLELTKRFMSRLHEIVDELGKKRNVKTSIIVDHHYPLLCNDVKLTQELQTLFGNTSSEGLPLKASEDFSFYSNVVPGCFFMFTIGSQAGKSLHVNNYNFNDQLIERASENWLKLIRNRLSF